MQQKTTLTKKERRQLARDKKRQEKEKKERVAKIKKYIFKTIIVGLLVFGGYKFWVWVSTPISKNEAPLGQPSISPTDQIRGNPESSLTLVEYSDFQCPACKSYAPLVAQLVEEFGDRIRLVYKHFPLTSIHRNAFDAALASEAAGKNGKFWEMHDLLFERQKDWENSRNPKKMFIEYAKELGIGEEVFKQDYQSDDVEARVRSQIAEGNLLGINSTPSFFLNGAKVTNPQNYESFKSLIEQALPEEQNLKTQDQNKEKELPQQVENNDKKDEN